MKSFKEYLQYQSNHVKYVMEVAALPPTQFSVEPEPMSPGVDGILNMPVGSGEQYMLNSKHAWNWSPEGGWPDGKKYFDGLKIWTYDKETDRWYRIWNPADGGEVRETIPHGHPELYSYEYDEPGVSAQPSERENTPVRPKINRPGWPEPSVIPGFRNR